MRKKRKKRLAARPRPRGSRRKAFKAVIFLLLFLVASAALWFLIALASPFFRMPSIPLHSVRIEGRGPLDSHDILSKAGIVRDTDIMELDLAGARDGLIRREPYIRKVRIIRNPASGRLGIKLTLRTPAALVNADGVLMAVDRSGFVIGDIETIDFKDLPVITGLGIERPAPGSALSGVKINAALSILKHAGESGLDSTAPLSEINMSDMRHIVLYAGDEGLQIRLGESGLEEKIKEAAAIVSYLEQRGEKAEYIDLRFRRTIVKPRGGSE